MDSDQAGGKCQPNRIIRGKWLVQLSTLVAIYLEVIPVEMDTISGLWLRGAFSLALAVKLLCVTVILLPLVIYVFLNGPSALWHVKGRVVVIATIIGIHLIFFASGL